MSAAVRDRVRVGMALVFAAVLLAVGLRGTAALQGPPAQSVIKGTAFTFNRIADGLYHAVGTGEVTVGCNSTIIVNADDVLIVDSHITPAAADALQQELKLVTTKPIRYVVNTHWHFDHAHGNQVFGPGVEIIGHEFTRAVIAAGESKRGRTYEGFTAGLPSQIEDLRKRAAAATDSAERARLQKQVTITENHYRSVQAVTLRQAGVSPEQAATQIDLRAHATHFPAITAPGANLNAVLRAYELMEGKVR